MLNQVKIEFVNGTTAYALLREEVRKDNLYSVSLTL